MSKENPTREEQLFIHLISSYVTSAWVSLGKLKNPITDKIERDLEHASFSLDMLDLIAKRMGSNLEDWESQILNQNLTDLKLNYMEELKNDEKSANKTESDETSDDEATKTGDTAGETKE
ncbi:DUF1844 domain-containing protein [Candidatus Neomarinimicrobiota bacterium]